MAAAERAAGQLSSRRAALEEGRARLAENLEETQEQFLEAETRLSSAADLDEVNIRLANLTSEVTLDRAALAEARAIYDGLRREAENRMRRLEAIGHERKSWVNRADNADRQITSLSERRLEAEREAENLADAPDEIAERNRILLSQLSEAEALRKDAADKLAVAENRQRELDQACNRRHSGSGHSARGQGTRRGTARCRPGTPQGCRNPHRRGAELRTA